MSKALLVKGRGQKLINQILLSALKPLFLPACIRNKTALKYINTQADTHPKLWAIGQKHQATLRFGTWERVSVCPCMFVFVSVCVCAFVCLSLCKGREVAEGLDGWQKERTTSTQSLADKLHHPLYLPPFYSTPTWLSLFRPSPTFLLQTQRPAIWLCRRVTLGSFCPFSSPQWAFFSYIVLIDAQQT